MLAELATMIPEQLDLFGGSPKPPQKIRVEETTPPITEDMPESTQVEEDALPEWIAEATDSALGEETIPASDIDPVSVEMDSMESEDSAQTEELIESFIESAPDPVSDVIAWMEPGDHEPAPTLPEPVIIPTASIVIELPSHGKQKIETSDDEAAPVAMVQVSDAVAENNHRADEPGMQQLNIPPDEILFKRQYYSMRETAAMFDITHSMLRYWENEFDILQPRKNRKGDRYFRPIDIKNLQLIYHLLKVRKFTLDGAREYLRNNNKALDTFEMIQKLEKVKSFLHELKAHL